MPTESEIIASIRRRSRRTEGILVGIGDDAAVIRPKPGRDLLACCDLLVEDVHFRREWCDPRLIGRKALAVNLSDIAAMGGVPRYAMISMAIPGESSAKVVDELFEGIFQLAEETGIAVIGGDTSKSPGPLFIDVSVIGDCPSGRAVTRAGARPGDVIFVTGSLGASTVGLRLLESGARLGDPSINAHASEALKRHLDPTPQLQFGSAIGERGLATAMIDISDGLSTDLGHIVEESDCGAIIFAESIPVAQCVRDYIQSERAVDPLELALNGGEEYELLFTTGPENVEKVFEMARETGKSITRIGEITSGKGMILRCDGEDRTLQARGFEHVV